MKKICRNLLLGLIISIMSISTVIGSEFKKTIDVIYNKVSITVNGEKVASDNILYDGTTYVPLRTVAEMLNKEVHWDGETNTASIDDKKIGNLNEKEEYIKKSNFQGRKSLEVFYNRVNITVNGKKVASDNILYDGTTYAPLRAVSEMLDKEVGWDGKISTASIDDKNLVNSEESMKKNYLDNLFYNKDLLAKEFEKLMNLMNHTDRNKEWASKLEENLQSIEKIADDSINYKVVPKEFIELERLKILSMEEFKKMVNFMKMDLKDKDDELLFTAGNHLSEGTYYLNLLVKEVEYLSGNKLLEI